ncbi:MAG TPA: tRNA pseudouridine(38-40) synthase TruA [Kofleriaceae bacterium]|nr:tRNA pseudouridine(38-40) synthase TruA [Kofleriaceae bacterium]
MTDAPAERQLRLTIEYDGRTLGGWQRQANAPTVQAHLEDTLARIVQHEVRVTGASRTDAGVHALGQVAAFRTARPIAPYNLRRALNSLLPPTIAVTDVAEAPDDFHPRFSATGKHYRYLVLARPDRAPRWEGWAWHRPQPLDREAMARAAAGFLGEHDFRGFRATTCTARTTRRRIHALDLSAPAPELLALDVRGNAFLHNMVRIIAGTLVEVGLGRLDAAAIPDVIASGERARAGPTAPAHGLTLMSVSYDGPGARARPAQPGM